MTDIMRLGTFLSLGNPEICEMLGNGLDFVVIDSEHSVLMDRNLTNMLRALPSGIVPWVRVKRPDITGTALDLGARAILVPQIRSMDDVKAAVDSFLYPPRGKRGWGPGRSAKFGIEIMELLGREKENELWLQIETRESLDILDRIAETESVSGLFVGPGDLSLALGHPGEWSNPDLKKAIDRVFDTCRKNGKLFGIFVGDPGQVKQWEEKGADLVLMGADSMFFLQGYNEALKKAGRN